MYWFNVTALHFVATGGTDQGHTLQQYLLFDGETAEVNQDVYDNSKDAGYRYLRTDPAPDMN